MNVTVLATSHTDHIATKDNFDTFGGMAAGVCYMQDTFETLRTEAPEKTARRVKMTKENAHHSVYDHCSVSMYLDGIPRVIECLLDNERMMTSSVKSGRYTRHALQPKELELYDKWHEIFKTVIAEKYAGQKYFTPSRIDKLAMENARYLTGAFTPVSMVHTVSYRQLNYVYGFIRDFVEKQSSNDFINKLKPYLTELLVCFDKTGYIDAALINNGKNRTLSLFAGRTVGEHFGDVYAVNYRGSFAYYLHANRHRTLKYAIVPPPAPKKLKFYTPEILKGKRDLAKQWLADLDVLRENYPQAMILDITEMGNLDDFVLKVFERKCTAVLLETMHRTNEILARYHTALETAGRNDLSRYLRGSRCTFGNYKCPMPCGFGEGVTEKRII